MIGKTRMGENHINRLMPTEMFDWKLKILILARTQVTDQALGGLLGYWHKMSQKNRQYWCAIVVCPVI